MGAYIKKSTALKCALHQTVMAACVDALEDKGYFRKSRILDGLNYSSVVGDVIRWDYLRDFIEDDHGIELIPVAARFFAHEEDQDLGMSSHPRRYIASGHGKRTEGYCSAEFGNGSFTVACIVQKNAMARGLIDSAQKSRKNAEALGIDINSRLTEQSGASALGHDGA